MTKPRLRVTIQSPDPVLVAAVLSACENAVAVQKIREWCEQATSIFCSHGEIGPYDCERCEAIQDCAAAVRALLPPVGEVPSCSPTVSTDPNT